LNSKLSQGRPRRMWLDDIKSWTGLDSYEKIKNLANDRKSWRACSITCQPSDTEDDSWWWWMIDAYETSCRALLGLPPAKSVPETKLASTIYLSRHGMVELCPSSSLQVSIQYAMLAEMQRSTRSRCQERRPSTVLYPTDSWSFWTLWKSKLAKIN